MLKHNLNNSYPAALENNSCTSATCCGVSGVLLKVLLWCLYGFFADFSGKYFKNHEVKQSLIINFISNFYAALD